MPEIKENFEHLSYIEKSALGYLFASISDGKIHDVGLHKNDFLFALDKVLYGEIDNDMFYKVEIIYGKEFIRMIKAYRMITNCGLRESKIAIDNNKKEISEDNVFIIETRSIIYAKFIKYIVEENKLAANIKTSFYDKDEE